ncbi:Ral GEF with PH domain and SH3-binding motif 1, partial [Intoshia linei]
YKAYIKLYELSIRDYYIFFYYVQLGDVYFIYTYVIYITYKYVICNDVLNNFKYNNDNIQLVTTFKVTENSSSQEEQHHDCKSFLYDVQLEKDREYTTKYENWVQKDTDCYSFTVKNGNAAKLNSIEHYKLNDVIKPINSLKFEKMNAKKQFIESSDDETEPESSADGPTPHESDYFTFDILKIGCEDIANQMTLIDKNNFSKIEPNEFLSCSWNTRDKCKLTPNIVAFTKQFNQYSFMVQDEILKYSIPKERAEVIMHFIRVAKKLYDLNNFSGCSAIVSAFQSNSIFRLSLTWDQVPKREYGIFIKLTRLFSENNNWSTYRLVEKNAKTALIPYIVVYLTDLMYVNVAYPKSTIFQSHHRNDHLGNIIRTICEFQKCDYSIKKIPFLHTYLSCVRYIEETKLFIEDDYYKLSLSLEPNIDDQVTSTPKKPKHSRVSSVGSNKLFNNKTSTPINSKLSQSFATPVKNLIDDSAVVESPYFSCYMRDESVGDVSLTSSIKRGQSNVKYEELIYEIENYVKRRTYFKKSKKIMVQKWTKYWACIHESCLIFFNCRHISGFAKKINRSSPCRVYNIIDWTITLCYDDNNPTECVNITNPLKGDTYQLKFYTKELALQWYTFLNKAAKLHIKLLPDNLIHFDDTSTESKSSNDNHKEDKELADKLRKTNLNCKKDKDHFEVPTSKVVAQSVKSLDKNVKKVYNENFQLMLKQK